MSFLKAKKFLVSKATDSKMGRAQLLKQVGDDVSRMLQALEIAIEAFSDKATAETIGKDTLKLSAKAGLLVRENVIPATVVAPLSAPLVAAATRLIEGLESKPGSVDPAPASEAVRYCGYAIVEAIKPYMKEKNWRRAAELTDFYADSRFLSFLFNSATLHVQRDAILCTLHNYTAPHGGAGSRRKTKKCVVHGCELPRLNIRGAEYCQGHQAVTYANGPPAALETFLHNTEHASIFQDYLSSAHPELLPFAEVMSAISDFAACTSRALIKSRAPMLFDRFLRSPEISGVRYLPVPEELLAGVRDIVDSGAAGARVFEPIKQWCYAQLQHVYATDFRSSEQYKAWADDNLGLEVPPIAPGRLTLLESVGLKVSDIVPSATATAAVAPSPALAGAGAK